MTHGKNETALAVRTNNTTLRNKTSQVSAIQRADAGPVDYVPHVTASQVKLMAVVASQNRRHGERNVLLIKFLFDGCLQVSEALGVRPVDLQRTPDGWVVRVLGKGSKLGVVAISASIAAELQSYCYRAKIGESERIFRASRSQAKAGIPRPSKQRDHVGSVHILRHSGAIERLRLTGNPRATQSQLRHKSALMTMRYLKTLSTDESLKIQQGVELW